MRCIPERKNVICDVFDSICILVIYTFVPTGLEHHCHENAAGALYLVSEVLQEMAD